MNVIRPCSFSFLCTVINLFIGQKTLEKCRQERKKALKSSLVVGGKIIPPLGVHVPICEIDGSFSEIQCDHYTGDCWCVDRNGTEKDGTRTRDGKPICHRM